MMFIADISQCLLQIFGDAPVLADLPLRLEVHVLGVLLVPLDPGLQHVDEELLAVHVVGGEGDGLLLDGLQLSLEVVEVGCQLQLLLLHAGLETYK